MARRCELTGKAVLVGNNVSHANNKTKKRFLPNLQYVRFFSEILGSFHQLRVSVAALRSVDKNGGIDGFLAKVSEENLSDGAKRLRKTILAAQAEQKVAA